MLNKITAELDSGEYKINNSPKIILKDERAARLLSEMLSLYISALNQKDDSTFEVLTYEFSPTKAKYKDLTESLDGGSCWFVVLRRDLLDLIRHSRNEELQQKGWRA